MQRLHFGRGHRPSDNYTPKSLPATGTLLLWRRLNSKICSPAVLMCSVIRRKARSSSRCSESYQNGSMLFDRLLSATGDHPQQIGRKTRPQPQSGRVVSLDPDPE